VRKAFTKRPELVGILILDGVILVLADLFQLSLALAALDFSSWVVLPWAFYDKVSAHEKEVGWLRTSEVYLFISGFLFLFYVIGEVSNQVTNLTPFLTTQILPLAQGVLWFFGFVLLLVGFYNAFRVVNYCSGIGESGRIMFKLSYLPFLVFNICEMSIQFYGIYQAYEILHEIKLIGLLYGAFVLIALFGTFPAFKWFNHIYGLVREINLKGLVALILLVLPYLLLAFLYITYRLGVSFF
jgi:hypothetical protein